MNVFAAAMPVDVAEPAFAGELEKPRAKRHVQVGQMRKNEHRRMMLCDSSRSQPFFERMHFVG
jgi:hypothetical protein